MQIINILRCKQQQHEHEHIQQSGLLIYKSHDLMVVEDDVTLVPTVETDRCITYQDLEVTVKTCEKGSIQ